MAKLSLSAKTRFINTSRQGTPTADKHSAVASILDLITPDFNNVRSLQSQEIALVMTPEKGTVKHVLSSHHKFNPRALKEEPLSQFASPEDDNFADVTPNVGASIPVAANAAASKIPSTLLPICHATNDSCISSTNSCSGHGTCVLKSSSRNSDTAVGDCYACKCHKTVLSYYDDGTPKKTISWGGSACQKKDISIQFFLLAGFTVVIVAAVAWGVGLLFSIGNEDLPSVIGAGVSGPRAAPR